MRGINRHAAAVLLIAWAAFGLRLCRLETRAVWYDEAFSVFLSEQSLDRIIVGTAADIQPPLYYVLLHYWQALGTQASVLRYLSVSFSMLSVALVYALTRRLFSERAALYAMLFCAVAPFQVYYAQELRMYALLEFALLLYAYAFLRLADGTHANGSRPTSPGGILEGQPGGLLRRRQAPPHNEGGTVGVSFVQIVRNNISMMLLLAVSGAAALYSQSLAILTWVVPDLYILLRRDGALLKRLVAAQAFGLVLFLPWVVVQASQALSLQHSYWTTPPGVAEALQLLIAFTVNQPLPAWLLPVALFATLAVDAIMALEVVRARRGGLTVGLAVMAAFLVLPPALMFALSYAFRSVFVVRAVILSAAAFVVLLGWLVARSKNTVAQASGVAAGVGLALVALAFQLSYDEFPRSPFRAADAYVRAHRDAQDAVIHDNKLSYLPMRYYDRALPQDWLADPPEAGSNTLSPLTMEQLGIFPGDMAVRTQSVSRVWFVIFQRALDEAASAGTAPGNKAWMDAHFKQVALVHFNDLNLYLYEK